MMRHELVYVFSHKLYLFIVYTILYIGIANQHTYTMVVGFLFALCHADFIKNLSMPSPTKQIQT